MNVASWILISTSGNNSEGAGNGIRYVGVSKNRGGPPKSSILIGFSIINHPFWGITIFGSTHVETIFWGSRGNGQETKMRTFSLQAKGHANHWLPYVAMKVSEDGSPSKSGTL